MAKVIKGFSRFIMMFVLVLLVSLPCVSLGAVTTTCGAGPCPEEVASDSGNASINSLGEIVWSQYDQASGRYQIFSSLRGQLTSDQEDHDSPAINSMGDLVWLEYSNGTFNLKGTISGQPVTLWTSPYWIGKIDINDLGEVVWEQYDAQNVSQIFSSLRGELTSGSPGCQEPSINNNGDVVCYGFPTSQIFLIAAGSTVPMPITPAIFDTSVPFMSVQSPVILDNGDILWAEQPRNTTPEPYRLVSRNRGVLVPSLADQLGGLDANACGDVVYTALTPDVPVLYRLGSNAPCISYPGAHDTREEAATVAFGDIFTGLIDSTTKPVEWYEFPAASGDTVNLTVNFDNRPPNTLVIGLYDYDGNLLSGPTAANPLGIHTTASYSGSYYLKLESQGGRFGYTVSLMTLPESIFSLAVGKDPASTGTGRIESAPSGIDLSSEDSFTKAAFPAGIPVILSATADGNSVFTGWSGACSGTDTCTLSMTAARSVTATFMLQVAALCGSDNGNLLTSPPTNLCAAGAASAVTGSGPWGWTCSGSYGGSDAVCAASLQTYAVTFASDGNGTLTGATNQIVNHGGNTAEVTANAAADYHFVNWTDANGVVLTATNPVIINSVTSVMTVTANFAHNPVDGVCGSTSTGIFRTAPTSSLCSPDAVVALTPTDTGWTWTCPGSYGGSNASCSSTRDVTAPELLVSTLANGTATNNNTLNVSGSVTDANSLTLTINNTPITVNSDHSYTYAITLVDGDNQITVIATDSVGNEATDQRTIRYDATAPNLTITAPADNSKTAQVLATVSGTVDETATVVVKSTLNGSQTATIVGNSFTATVNLEQGLNTIDIIATDLAGNSSSDKRTVTYDPLKPSLGVTSPASDMTVYTDRTTISGTAGDTISGIADLVITADGKEYRPTVTDGSFSQEVTFSDEKLYPVTVTVIDAAGNSEAVTRNIIFSRGIIAINGYAATTATTAVKLSLGYFPSAAKMQFLANNTSWTAWEAFAATKAVILPGGDGRKTVYVRFMDSSGTTSQVYSTTITLDGKAPTGSITINNGAAVTTSPVVTLNLAVADITDGISMQVSNSSSFVGASWEPYVASKPFDLTETYGTRTVYARFKDAGGKVSAAVSDTIIYQQAAPATGGSGALIINGGAQYTILPGVQLAITRPDVSDTQMSLSSNGTTWSGWTAIPAAARAYTLPAGDGIKTVYVKFRTAALAESATYADTIILDTKPPVGTITINTGAFVTSNRHVTLSLTAADLNGVSDMQFSSNGTTWSTWEIFAVSKEIDLLPGDGARKVYVRYRDNAGKVSPAYYDTISVDTKAPLGTVKINAGAASTANPLVTLNIAASGVPVALQFSLDNGVSWSDWEPYAKVRKVTLPGGSGARSVLVKLKDLAGNVSGSIGDTILLTP